MFETKTPKPEIRKSHMNIIRILISEKGTKMENTTHYYLNFNKINCLALKISIN